MKVYILPLEPLDKRYTKQWYCWFKEVFQEEGVDFEYINGEKVESKLEGKFFLDMKTTFVWKFKQLKKLFKKDLQDGDVIFILDGEFPGIEAIEYFRKFYNKKVRIVELWHAGTYDIWDLTYQKGLERIGKNLEEVWFDIADLVFVATSFHKKLILKNRLVDRNKIKVTGWPLDVFGLAKKAIPWNERKHRLIFTSRLSIEKGIDIIEEVAEKYPVFITQKHDLKKEKYYKELALSKGVIAPSRQETFGYGVAEGMAMNVIPIVPDGLSFTDYVPRKYRYRNKKEMYDLIEKVLTSEEVNVRKYVEKYDYRKVIRKMLLFIERL